ncbi:hypothetical protein Nepgr_016401 [Nepenthes gracilis]|uniref:Uncharacterized protein n=1 Tax=Nepenthes gracilis TaxID=150966 RepID=A0AAD3SPQ2_NEPGR|nr:hypothetical protein Nepgr_016401 [Nepenthes gracilis]
MLPGRPQRAANYRKGLWSVFCSQSDCFCLLGVDCWFGSIDWIRNLDWHDARWWYALPSLQQDAIMGIPSVVGCAFRFLTRNRYGGSSFHLAESAGLEAGTASAAKAKGITTAYPALGHDKYSGNSAPRDTHRESTKMQHQLLKFQIQQNQHHVHSRPSDAVPPSLLGNVLFRPFPWSAAASSFVDCDPFCPVRHCPAQNLLYAADLECGQFQVIAFCRFLVVDMFVIGNGCFLVMLLICWV